MDIKWYFDESIGKRFGSSTTNTVALANAVSSGFTSGAGTLSAGLIAYWNLNEATGTRFDGVGTNNLVSFNSVTSAAGILSGAALYAAANSQILQVTTSRSLELQGGNFTFSTWIFKTNTQGGTFISKDLEGVEFQFIDRSQVNAGLRFLIATSNGGTGDQVDHSINISTSTWYNVIGWYSGNSHIGISVNLTTTTFPTTVLINAATNDSDAFLAIGGLGANTGGGAREPWTGRIDETGYWNRVLTASERSDLYNSGTANTYVSGALGFGWASFDFGAGASRYYTVCAGTGIFASTDLGRTFAVIGTSRSQAFQYLDRSRNVLIATSDVYDRTLYWAGSAGTFAVGLTVNSAPAAKYSINYQGFLILLNSQDSNNVISTRRFNYADENLQLTSAWTDNFDLPSSADDQITAPFILNKFLYVSTQYKLFRLAYTGGNPDWSYIVVKNFGYVPRTVKVFTLKQGQVAVGLDWNRRLRAFDGYDDQIISDNVEQNNNYCDFAMQKISLGGSGLTLSHAEFDPNQQEYRLNVSIGLNSSSVSHALILNARTLSLYPYSGQNYSTMCVAQSGGQQFMMAVDRAGYAHILNSSNLEVATAINEVYDSPIMFNKSPSSVTKNNQLNFYFNTDSCGTLYFQERFDLSNVFSDVKPLRDKNGNAPLLSTESTLQLLRTIDLPSVQNTYQFRLTSSSGTANPWKLTYFDYLNKSLGYGRGG